MTCSRLYVRDESFLASTAIVCFSVQAWNGGPHDRAIMSVKAFLVPAVSYDGHPSHAIEIILLGGRRQSSIDLNLSRTRDNSHSEWTLLVNGCLLLPYTASHGWLLYSIIINRKNSIEKSVNILILHSVNSSFLIAWLFMYIQLWLSFSHTLRTISVW